MQQSSEEDEGGMGGKWGFFCAASLLFVFFLWNGGVVSEASSSGELSDPPYAFGGELSKSLWTIAEQKPVFRTGSSKVGGWFFAQTSHQGLETSLHLPADALVSPKMGRSGGTKFHVTLLSRTGQQVSFPLSADTAGDSLRFALPRTFRPGLYSLTVAAPDSSVISTQDFAWGVLAVNPGKDRYHLNEVADFAFGVLDERGEIVCDADLTLTLSAPDGSSRTLSTRDGTVIATGTCGRKEAGLLEPDYRANIIVNQQGTYAYDVVAVTGNGTWTVAGELPVVTDAPVMIRRQAATRLWPLAPSTMTVRVHFDRDFSGAISDIVPASFVVMETQPAASVRASTEEQEAQVIQWEGTWKAGETVLFRYAYDAPDVSPDFFLVGPLVLQPGIGHALQELRQWQIANDAGESWLTGSFTYRKEITIDQTNVDSNLASFPLNVKFSADTDIGAHVRLGTGTGYDIRFTSSGGLALLPYEREDFHVRAGSGAGNFWVKVPTVYGAANTIIYLYYGSGSAADGQSSSAVWDANFAGVWHLSGSTLSTVDSTSNNNDGTSTVGVTAAEGVVDGGGKFRGTVNTYCACSEAPDEATCNSGGCTPSITGCDGTHNDCSTYDESSCSVHDCTPDYSDPYNCACGDPYNCACEDPNNCTDYPYGGDPYNCGECMCESCDTFSSTCYPGGNPYNCSCGDPYNCSCGVIYTSCLYTPHACQQTECDASTDGCSHTYLGCTGTEYLCDSTTNIDYINVGTYNGSLNITGNAITLSAWAKWNGVDLNGWVISKMTDTGPSGSWGLYIRNNTVRMGLNTGSWGDIAASALTVSANAWHYVVAAYNGTNVIYYVDGVAATPISKTGNIVSKNQPAVIGFEDGWESQWFGGLLDEIRVSNIARSAAWNKFEYYNMSQADHELAFSAQEGSSSSSSSSSVARHFFYFLD